MGVNENIFRILKDRHMTQKEFSRLSGISESTISDWKRKGKTPGTDNLITISRTLEVSLYELLSEGENDISSFSGADYVLNADEKSIIELYRRSGEEQKKRITSYLESLTGSTADMADKTALMKPVDSFAPDAMFLNQKLLARKLRKLAKLDRLVLDEAEHASGLNLHLLKYLDYIGIDRFQYVKQYLSNIQPFMISEIKSQEKFDNAICILDDFYRISVYIKVDATIGEEVVVSFHENNKRGIAKRNSLSANLSYVYVFADSIGSHIEGSDNYSINLFLTRGASTFPINVPATRYDNDVFLVRYTYINNAIIDIANNYLEDLYTSDVDFAQIELFTSLHQLSFTSYGKDIFSNISIMIDSLLIQPDAIGRQIADSALCIYCSTLELLPKDKEALLETLKERYKVNSVRILPSILERIELNIQADGNIE